jgi:hypothetical protein
MTLPFHPSQELELANRSKGIEDPQEDVWFCKKTWTDKGDPRSEWVHQFVHTLNSVSQS